MIPGVTSSALRLLAALTGPGGSLIAEITTLGIAERWNDRLVDYLERVSTRVAALEATEAELAQLRERVFADDGAKADLLHLGAERAARAPSSDRRGYIAEIVARGMRSDELTADESRKFLSILDALSDAEVVTLIYRASGPTLSERSDFYDRNESVLRPASRSMDADDAEVRRAALQDGYLKNLERLGLITAAPIPGRGSVNVASLGMELLKQIGIEDPRSIR